MTEAELQAIKERAEKATPGPWVTTDKTSYPHQNMGIWRKVGPKRFEHLADVPIGCAVRRKPCAEELFIAHAREDIPALIAEVESLRSQLKAEQSWARHLQTDLGDSIEYQIDLKAQLDAALAKKERG